VAVRLSAARAPDAVVNERRRKARKAALLDSTDEMFLNWLSISLRKSLCRGLPSGFAGHRTRPSAIFLLIVVGSNRHPFGGHP
jgi:hypothetical protein